MAFSQGSLLSLVDYPLLLKDFTYINILAYASLINGVHNCENNYNFIMMKGSELYRNRFVTDVRFVDDQAKEWTIHARVKAEMKKTKVYKTHVIISHEGKVSYHYHNLYSIWISNLCHLDLNHFVGLELRTGLVGLHQ